MITAYVQDCKEQVLWVQALARIIALCSWVKFFTLAAQPLSTQVYKWPLANLILRASPTME